MSLGSGIRDPGSGKNLSRIQGSIRHRIPDPDPQNWFEHALLPAGQCLSIGCFQTGPWEDHGRRGQQGGRYWEAMGTPEITRAWGGYGTIGPQTDIGYSRTARGAATIKHMVPDENINIFGLGRYNYSKLKEPRHWFSIFWHCQKERI